MNLVSRPRPMDSLLDEGDEGFDHGSTLELFSSSVLKWSYQFGIDSSGIVHDYQFRFAEIEQAARTAVMRHFGNSAFLTPEEQRLFEEIKEPVTSNRQQVFEDLPVDYLALQ